MLRQGRNSRRFVATDLPARLTQGQGDRGEDAVRVVLRLGGQHPAVIRAIGVGDLVVVVRPEKIGCRRGVVGETPVTVTAEDGARNTSTCTFTVTAEESGGCGCQTMGGTTAYGWAVALVLARLARRRRLTR